jgi:hypothetical protein
LNPNVEVLNSGQVGCLDGDFNGKKLETIIRAEITETASHIIEINIAPDQSKAGDYVLLRINADEALDIGRILISLAAFAAYQAGVKCGFETAREAK